MRPSAIRHEPASEAELMQFEADHGPIPLEFREFLASFGGGVVGSEWVDGIAELGATQVKFKKESGPHGWNLPDTFIIGWDGAGNPFGIHAVSGAVLVQDHTFGGVHELAPSFRAFLRKGLETGGQP
jgi:hypothetical protein